MLGCISLWGSLSPLSHVKLVKLACILGKRTGLGEREFGCCPPYNAYLWWHSSPVPHTVIIPTSHHGASLMAQMVKNVPAMQETRVRFLGQEDPLAARSSQADVHVLTCLIQACSRSLPSALAESAANVAPHPPVSLPGLQT